MLIDPQHDDTIELSDTFFYRQIAPENAVQIGGDLISLLTDAGWELDEDEVENSYATLARLGYYWHTAPPPPDPPIPPDRKPVGNNYLWFRTEFNGIVYVAYDPARSTPAPEGEQIDGKTAVWYPAGLTTSDTATEFVVAVNANDPVFGMTRLPDDTTSGNAMYQFRVTPRTPKVGFSFDNIVLADSDGLQVGPTYTSGGYRILRSQRIMRTVYDEDGEESGEVPEGLAMEVRIRTVYWSGGFGGATGSSPNTGGLLRIELTVRPDGGGEFVHLLHPGERKAYANPHQFCLWTGEPLGQILVSMLRSHPKHLMGASPVLIVGSESSVWRIWNLTVLDWRKSVYWRDGFGEGFNNAVNSLPATGSHAYDEAQGWVEGALPALMIRGCQQQPLMTRMDQPLAEAPWVVLAGDPHGGVDGSIAGKLWDMLVLSGPLESVAAPGEMPEDSGIVFGKSRYELLATNGSLGSPYTPDVWSTLWIRTRKLGEDDARI